MVKNSLNFSLYILIINNCLYKEHTVLKVESRKISLLFSKAIETASLVVKTNIFKSLYINILSPLSFKYLGSSRLFS